MIRRSCCTRSRSCLAGAPAQVLPEQTALQPGQSTPHELYRSSYLFKWRLNDLVEMTDLTSARGLGALYILYAYLI
jgi:hypothetical protein